MWRYCGPCLGDIDTGKNGYRRFNASPFVHYLKKHTKIGLL
jgi:hypothetical protein